jgi:hypothetical protein
MIIDTEKDQITITISLDDAFELLRGAGLSDKAWMHLAGIMGEWYKDTYHERGNNKPSGTESNEYLESKRKK